MTTLNDRRTADTVVTPTVNTLLNDLFTIKPDGDDEWNNLGALKFLFENERDIDLMVTQLNAELGGTSWQTGGTGAITTAQVLTALAGQGQQMSDIMDDWGGLAAWLNGTHNHGGGAAAGIVEEATIVNITGNLTLPETGWWHGLLQANADLTLPTPAAATTMLVTVEQGGNNILNFPNATQWIGGFPGLPTAAGIIATYTFTFSLTRNIWIGGQYGES